MWHVPYFEIYCSGIAFGQYTIYVQGKIINDYNLEEKFTAAIVIGTIKINYKLHELCIEKF